MTLNDHFALCFKIHAFSEPTTKISMKIDPYYQRQRCSAMTVVSGSNRKRRFSEFRTLHLRNLRKWGQHYCIVLFSPLSSFHWPQNTWPWVTLNGHFALNFHYNEQPFKNLFLHTYRWACLYLLFSIFLSRDQRRCVEADRDPQYIWDPRKDWGSFVDATSSKP